MQDNYKDFVARTFDQFDDDELEFYISRNVMAVKAVVERAKPDYALANHMVMGPYILSQALGDEVPYVAKIHGSAMEYIVRPHPRFLPYARTGVRRGPRGAGRIAPHRRAHLGHAAHPGAREADLSRSARRGHRALPSRPRTRGRDRRPRRCRRARARDCRALGYGPGQKVATDAFYDRVRTAARMDGMMGYPEVAEEIAGMQTTYENDGHRRRAPATRCARWRRRAMRRSCCTSAS